MTDGKFIFEDNFRIIQTIQKLKKKVITPEWIQFNYHKIHEENLKITTPEDFLKMSDILAKRLGPKFKKKVSN